MKTQSKTPVASPFRRSVSLFLVVGLVLCTTVAVAAPGDGDADPKASTNAPTGKLVAPTNSPANSPMITLRADDMPLGAVLKDICTKAKWGLVLDVPGAILEQRITVLLPKTKPANDVLKMVLTGKSLDATFTDDVLHISYRSFVPSPTTVKSKKEKEIQLSAPRDTDSKDIVVTDFSEFKKLKSRFKDKFKQHRKNHTDKHDGKIERVEIGQPVVIEKDEVVHKAVSVGDSVTVHGNVEAEAVAVGGDMIIKKGARIGNDAVAIGGDVRVESGGVVEGEVVAVGGKVIVEDGAIVEGDRVSVNIPVPAIGGVAGLIGMGALFGLLAAVFRSFVVLAVALIVVWLAPERVNIAKDYLVKKTGWSIFSGLLLFLGVVPAIVLLAMTIIGIPLIPFLLLFLVAVVVFGLAALLSWLGYWVPIFKNKKSPVGAVIIGFFVFLLLNVIPVIGAIFLLFASLAAAGATFLSRFGKKSRAL